MRKVTKLTPKILQKIIKEERERIALQRKKIQEAKKRENLEEIRRELKTYLALKREQKFLIERIKKINNRTDSIKRKIKES
jgi:hypothetical protein